MYIYIYWTKQMYIYKGPTIRLLRGGGGGMGDFRKNTPADCFPTLKNKLIFYGFLS